ncbi:MAG: SUMF1/EgtB/PvdO family nonheme iron enzyme [Cyanobacteria bacterium P01_F01_bin.143]
MTRIFISHSHADEAIAYKLFDFLIAALKLDDEDILCTSDPNSGLSFNSNSISTQLKSNLKQADALVALITADSLRSPWIPFEIGSFWPTEKTIVLILGPSLTPEKLPGPLKGWLSISIENDQAFEQLNQAINQLEIKLEIRQNVHRSRRDRYLKEFITLYQTWESSFSETDDSLQKQVEELGQNFQDQKELEKSLKDRIEQLEQELAETRSQTANQIQELEEKHKAEIERLKKEKQSQKNSVQSSHTQDFIEDLGNGVKLEMVAIPGGTFMMGSPEGEGKDNEKPQHQVTVKPFLMGKYPITQAQYRQLMGVNPSYFKDREDAKRRPVEQVSWDEAVEFCQRLSKLVGQEYRLPTEAEWEYACRSVISEGLTLEAWNKEYSQPFNFGKTISAELANYDGNIGETTEVGKYSPNAFGLYDMHGNVWEWCQDDWHVNYKDAPNDGNVWLSEGGSKKVIRGGSWICYPNDCRSAIRSYFTRDHRDSYIGFRVVCVAPRTT